MIPIPRPIEKTTTSCETQLGRRCLAMIRAGLPPSDRTAVKIFAFLDREHLRTDDPRHRRPADDPERDNERSEAGPHRRHDGDKKEEPGIRESHVRRAA